MCIQKGLFTAILLIGAFLAMVAFLKFAYTLFPSFPIFVIPNTSPKGKKIGFHRCPYLWVFSKQNSNWAVQCAFKRVYLLQSSSSDPSVHSLRWLHFWNSAMHFSPLAHLNWARSQEVPWQPSASSDLSRQSKYPSHFFSLGTQRPLPHLWSSFWQVR